VTILDDKLLPVVYDTVQTYGKTVTFQEIGSAVYDPGSGKTTESSITDHSVKVTPPSPYEHRLVDGDLIQQRDVSVLLPAKDLAFTPVQGMQVTIDGEALDIVRIEPLYSGASVCAYNLQLRQ
jgi:hypothetical protein